MNEDREEFQQVGYKHTLVHTLGKTYSGKDSLDKPAPCRRCGASRFNKMGLLGAGVNKLEGSGGLRGM
jgi:hypothetical protein